MCEDPEAPSRGQEKQGPGDSEARLEGRKGQEDRLFIGLPDQASLWLMQSGPGGRTPRRGLG